MFQQRPHRRQLQRQIILSREELSSSEIHSSVHTIRFSKIQDFSYGLLRKFVRNWAKKMTNWKLRSRYWKQHSSCSGTLRVQKRLHSRQLKSIHKREDQADPATSAKVRWRSRTEAGEAWEERERERKNESRQQAHCIFIHSVSDSLDAIVSRRSVFIHSELTVLFVTLVDERHPQTETANCWSEVG
jgi:hypothetical protein